MKLTVPLVMVTAGLLFCSGLLVILAPMAETKKESTEILFTSFLLLFFGLPTLVVGWILRPHLEAQIEADRALGVGTAEKNLVRPSSKRAA